MLRRILPPLLSTIAILGCPSGAVTAEPLPAPGVTSITSIYNSIPDITLAMTGYFTTGVALVDINGDGAPDLILANGNDMSPQPLVVYLNEAAAGNPNIFGPWPDWYSEEIAYFNGIAVGDVNGDGWPDVAVAVPFDKTRDISTGSVQVFFNHGGKLEAQPSYVSALCGCAPMSVAFADVDGDGDLDLVAAVPIAGKGMWPGNEVTPGRSQIYLNQGGSLGLEPTWLSDPMIAGAVVAADINQDGFLDLAFSAQQTSVFYGRPPGKGEFPLPVKPDWVSAPPGFAFSYGIDAGSPRRAGDHFPPVLKVPSKDGLQITVSTLCLEQKLASRSLVPFFHPAMGSACRSQFLSFQPETGEEPVWGSIQARQNASKLLLADLNADGYLELLGDQLGLGGTDDPDLGGPLWIFQGTAKGWGAIYTYQNEPTAWRSGQGLAVANLQCPGAIEQRALTFAATAQLTVLTLPERIVTVKKVTRGDRPARYAWAPGTNWVSLATPLALGETATVTYEVSPILDIALGVWNPQNGSNLYLSFLDASRCKRLSSTNRPSKKE